MKRVISLVLIMMLMVLPMDQMAVNAEIPLRVVVDGEELIFPDAQPFIDGNSRTQLPARFIAEALGAEVSWNPDTREATFVKGKQNLVITIDSRDYTLIGRKLSMDTEAIILEGRTFVPARYVAEAFGAAVSWDGDIRTVYIVSGQTDEITTGSGEITYVNGVAFNPVEDVNIYGDVKDEKLIDLLLAAVESFHFLWEDGVLYAEGEYPEAPEGYVWRVQFTNVRPEGYLPSSRSSSILGHPMSVLPLEGYFKEEMEEQDPEWIHGYEILLKLFNTETGQRSGYLLLVKDKVNRGTYAKYLDGYGGDHVLVTDQVDYDKMVIWRD